MLLVAKDREHNDVSKQQSSQSNTVGFMDLDRIQCEKLLNCNAKSQEANREVARLSASLCGGCMMDSVNL